jgi:hypothetical protein
MAVFCKEVHGRSSLGLIRGSGKRARRKQALGTRENDGSPTRSLGLPLEDEGLSLGIEISDK